MLNARFFFLFNFFWQHQEAHTKKKKYIHGKAIALKWVSVVSFCWFGSLWVWESEIESENKS